MRTHMMRVASRSCDPFSLRTTGTVVVVHYDRYMPVLYKYTSIDLLRLRGDCCFCGEG